MPIEPSLWAVPIVVAQVVLGWRRLLAYLRYFQQEGYDAGRFLAWTGIRPLTDPALVLAAACAWLAFDPGAPGNEGWSGWSAGLFTAIAAGLAVGQPDPRTSGKITLKMTWRATRIAAVTAGLAVIAWVAWVAVESSGLRALFAAFAIVIVVMPVLLMVAETVFLAVLIIGMMKWLAI
jgi:hypothetical protein